MSILFGVGIFTLLGYLACVADGYGLFRDPNADGFFFAFIFGIVGFPVWLSLILVVAMRKTLSKSRLSKYQFCCGLLGVALFAPTLYSLIESRL